MARRHSDGFEPTDDDALHEAIAPIVREFENLETRRGHKLSRKQMVGVIDELERQLDNDEPRDFGKAFEDFYRNRGKDVPDHDNHGVRIQHAAERLQDFDEGWTPDMTVGDRLMALPDDEDDDEAEAA